jgi:hypothetical protein
MRMANQYIKYQREPMFIKKPGDIEANMTPLKNKKMGEEKISNKEITEALNHLRGKNIYQELKKRVD